MSANDRYVGYAMLASCVATIDGVLQPQPATEGQLEALVARQGAAGVAAVEEGLAAAALGD